MKNCIAISMISVALLGAPAHAAVNATLPGGVITTLGDTQTTPAEVAALAIANPDLAPTIIAQAAALGVASPAQIVGAAETTSVADVATLVRAAAEVAPADAEAIARAGLLLLGAESGTGPAIARAAVEGLVNANVGAPIIAREAADTYAALSALVPEGAQAPIAQAIADTTPNGSDTAQSVQEDADGIETAGPLLPFGDRRARPLSRVPSFVELPAAASPN